MRPCVIQPPLLFSQMLDVTPKAEKCRVSVTVLGLTNTSTGRGHKFKVSAIMITRKSALGFAWPEQPAQFFAQDVFAGEFGAEELEKNQRSEEDGPRERTTT